MILCNNRVQQENLPLCCMGISVSFQNKLKWPIAYRDWYQVIFYSASSESNSWEYTQWAEDINDGVGEYSHKLRDHKKFYLPKAWYVWRKIVLVACNPKIIQ